MFNRHHARHSTILAALAVSALVGCSGGSGSSARTDSGSVQPHLSVLDRRTVADGKFGAPASGPTTPLSINGVYGDSCTERTGAWSVGLDGSTSTLDNPPLSVVQDDTNCVLTITSIEADSDYQASPTIPLCEQYQGPPATFTASGGSVFYANAMISDSSFTTDFTIQVEYSNQPSLVSNEASATSSYATMVSTATSGTVTAPDDSLDLTGLSIQTDVNGVVEVVGGVAVVIPVSMQGQTYVIDTSGGVTASTAYSVVDSIYSAQAPTMFSDTMIPASAFLLAGEAGGAPANLPAERNLIIANTDVSGVRSYEVFQISFNMPQ